MSTPKYLLTLISLLFISIPSYAKDQKKAKEQFTSNFITSVGVSVSATCQDTRVSQSGTEFLETNTKTASKNILVLANGRKFDIGWNPDNMLSWRCDDEIRVEYVGGLKALFNPYNS